MKGQVVKIYSLLFGFFFCSLASSQSGGPHGTVFGNSYSCDERSFVSFVFPDSRCDTLDASKTSRSVRLNGKCIGISSTDAVKACELVKKSLRLKDEKFVVYGTTDSCSPLEAIESVSNTTDCTKLSGKAWSIRYDGKCVNISDTDAVSACLRIQLSPTEPNHAHGIYSGSNSCEKLSFLGGVDEKTDCKGMGTASIGSIKVNGKCKNISNTKANLACGQIQSILRDARHQHGVYSASDSCSPSQFLAGVDKTTDCSKMGTSRAWSIKVDNKCTNIKDTTAIKACESVKKSLEFKDAKFVVYGTTDSCKTLDAIASVDKATNCSKLSGKAWSIRYDGKCVNIVDTDAASACRRIQLSPSEPNHAHGIYAGSNSCEKLSFLGGVNESTDCKSLGETTISSIKISGQCKDISNTKASDACQQIQSTLQDARHQHAVYSNSDSCSPSRFFAGVDSATDCDKIGTSRAWSIKINNKCTDIKDTDAKSACKTLKNGLLLSGADNVVFGTTDSCSIFSTGTVINAQTDCSQLSQSDKSWSIKVKGTCRDISDTTVRAACKTLKTEAFPE